ncbi:MAG: hypothetical protein ACM3X6_09980 [Patescibacteria group bacterium]
MKNGPAIAAALLVALMLVAAAAQAAEYPIDYVLKNGPALANKTVVVWGVVANSQARTPGPFDKTRGEYDLADATGATIHVRTMGQPPANGVSRRVRGVVDISAAPPVLIEKSGFPVPLYAALAVLAIVAVVLIVLLLSKPAPAALPAGVPAQAAPSGMGVAVPPIPEHTRTDPPRGPRS